MHFCSCLLISLQYDFRLNVSRFLSLRNFVFDLRGGVFFVCIFFSLVVAVVVFGVSKNGVKQNTESRSNHSFFVFLHVQIEGLGSKCTINSLIINQNSCNRYAFEICILTISYLIFKVSLPTTEKNMEKYQMPTKSLRQPKMVPPLLLLHSLLSY